MKLAYTDDKKKGDRGRCIGIYGGPEHKACESRTASMSFGDAKAIALAGKDKRSVRYRAAISILRYCADILERNSAADVLVQIEAPIKE